MSIYTLPLSPFSGLFYSQSEAVRIAHWYASQDGRRYKIYRYSASIMPNGYGWAVDPA